MKRKNESGVGEIQAASVDTSQSDLNNSKYDGVSQSKKPQINTVTHNLQNATKHLYRPPTSEEITELKETENLYKNSLFRMQIGYLLDEISLPDKKCKHVDTFLHSLRDFITGLKSGSEREIDDLSWLPKGVAYPIPELIKHGRKGKFQFSKPTNVNVVGSYLLKTTVKPNLNVDVTVEMPKECFHPRDFLNFQYHYKRALYLSILASKLRKWNDIESVEFSRIQNDPYKPILLLKPKGPAGASFTIKILPTIPHDLFKLFRLSPSRNNVRKKWFDQTNEEGNKDTGPPTPHYNLSILHDILFSQHLKTIHQLINDCTGAKGAVLLLKVWLRQRGLNKGPNAINGFIISMLLVHLLSKKKISAQMSSYQILRVAFQLIATSDWLKKGIAMDTTIVPHQPLMEEFHQHYDIVFVDSSGFMNLLGHVDTQTYEQFRHEAQLAIRFLDEKHTDPFESLFMKTVTFNRSVDHVFTLPSLLPMKWLKNDTAHKATVLDHGGDWKAIVSRFIFPILRKGLGNRIELFIVKPLKEQTWKLSKDPPKFSKSSLTCGILLNTEHYTDLVNMGPPADSPDAKSFRDFWGDKSELRRFQDGSINEAVVWNADCASEKRTICHQAISHLLKLYGKYPEDTLLYIGDQLDSLLIPKYRLSDSNKAECKGCGDSQMFEVIKSFDELSKNIKALKDVSLEIKNFHGISPVFRMTEVFSPRPRCVHKDSADGKPLIFPNPNKEKAEQWVPALEVVLQFESSGRWPEDVNAIGHLKAALHLKLAELFQSVTGLMARGNAGYVDVLKDGYVFRITVCHYREMVLRRSNSSSLTGPVKKINDNQANEIEYKLVTLPLHSSFIYSLHQQYVSYALTTRLAKRWVASQMLLGNHVTEEAIELIVAFIYLSPAPFIVPSCHVTGFLRFLDLIASWDWQREPLIVNISSSITDDDYVNIREHFSTQRDQLPAMFISVPHDKMTSQFTKPRPNAQALRRLKMLAEVSAKTLEDALFSGEDVKQIFRPPIDGYDVVIELNETALPRLYQSVDTRVQLKAPIKVKSKQLCLPVVNFNPVNHYLEELKSSFGDIAMFFYDIHGGNVIGIVWKPNAARKENFKVLGAGSKAPVQFLSNKNEDLEDTSLTVLPNLPAILCDMKIMGKGIVKKVVSK